MQLPLARLSQFHEFAVDDDFPTVVYDVHFHDDYEIDLVFGYVHLVI